MLEIWKTFLNQRENRNNFIFSIILLIIVLIILPNFLQNVEERKGFSFNDPFLSLFNPIDLTWLTFSLIYVGLIVAIIHLITKPQYLLLAVKTYAITVVFRIIVMFLLPLEPPSGMISLNDPFVQLFGSGEVLTKDLFFSGHTSTLFILFLCSKSRSLKILFLFGTIFVALSVVLQHVHYTVDVVAAPFFAYTSFHIAKYVDKQF